MAAADAPNVTDWMQGRGAVISLPLSLFAATFAGWLGWHEIRLRREDKAERRSAQARRVRLRKGNILREEASEVIEWEVINDSDEPIYRVNLFFVGTDSTVSLEAGSDEVEPGGRISASVERSCNSGKELRPLRPRLEFEDAAGHEWQRYYCRPPELVDLENPAAPGEDLTIAANRTIRRLVKHIWQTSTPVQWLGSQNGWIRENIRQRLQRLAKLE